MTTEKFISVFKSVLVEIVAGAIVVGVVTILASMGAGLVQCWQTPIEDYPHRKSYHAPLVLRADLD
jgi:dihydroorotate dehydrogenase